MVESSKRLQSLTNFDKKGAYKKQTYRHLNIKCIHNNRTHSKNTYRSSNGNSNPHRSNPNRNSNRAPSWSVFSYRSDHCILCNRYPQSIPPFKKLPNTTLFVLYIKCRILSSFFYSPYVISLITILATAKF